MEQRINSLNAEDILEEYREMVKAKAHMYFMLGGDMEDIIQEGMIGLYKAIQNFDESRGSSFRSFADLCVSRQILSAIKAANRKKYAALNTAVSLDKPISDEEGAPTLGETLAAGSDTDPETIAILSEMTEVLISPDSKLLSEMERKVLELLIQGCDYRCIAEILEKSPKQIDNSIQRIRAKLKVFFE